MLDKITSRPIGAPKGYEDWKAAFAAITVIPSRDADWKPVMPLLSRGQAIDDERGGTWTVLWGYVQREAVRPGDSESTFRYVYQYEAVNGRRTLD